MIPLYQRSYLEVDLARGCVKLLQLPMTVWPMHFRGVLGILYQYIESTSPNFIRQNEYLFREK
jgi:hypothetical protein